MSIFRWCATLALGVVTTVAATLAANAQSYPSRSIRLIVPFPAGTVSDLIGRIAAEELGKRLGQTFVIVNQTGGDTVIGVTLAAKAEPDGYTLLLGENSAYSITPQMNSVSYDMRTDFIPVGIVLDGAGVVLSAHPDTPYQNVAQLVSYAKANPGKVNFGSGSPVLRISVEMFKLSAGIDLRFVPYRGSVQAVADTIAGHMQLVPSGPTSVLQHLKSGKLKAIAVASAARLPSIPDVPTYAEGGYPDVVFGNWYGLFAPKGTPDAIVDPLKKELASILPALNDIARQNDFRVRLMVDDEMKQKLAFEYDRVGQAIKKAGLKTD